MISDEEFGEAVRGWFIDNDEIDTTQEAADILGVSNSTFIRWMADENLPEQAIRNAIFQKIGGEPDVALDPVETWLN